MKFFFPIIFLLFSCCLYAQPLPDSEIFLTELKISGENFELGKLTNISNRNGYDNQPSFLPDNSGLYFASMQPDSQTDVFFYNFMLRTIKQVTHTKEHEYSPTPINNGKFFSTVRIESPDTTQRLWKIDAEGNNPALISKKIKHVGYHGWYDDTTALLFLLPEPFKLVIANFNNEQTIPVAENIGRCILKIPGTNSMSFVYKENNSAWVIKKIDMNTRKVSFIANTLLGSEDFCWTKNGTLLMAKGNKLYKLNPAKDKIWKEIADFSNEINLFARIIINEDNSKLAIVGIKK